jgi:hypothetical protein
MIGLMAFLIRNVGRENYTFVWMIYGFCALVFIVLAAVIVTKRLFPALKGNVALQLDDEGMSDFVKEVSIKWTDIKEIHLIRGRSASIMRVDLKWESDYGSQIAIYLRWIKGKDADIYENTMAYFEQYADGPEEQAS